MYRLFGPTVLRWMGRGAGGVGVRHSKATAASANPELPASHQPSVNRHSTQHILISRRRHRHLGCGSLQLVPVTSDIYLQLQVCPANLSLALTHYPPRINQSHFCHLLSHPHAYIHLSIYLVTFLLPIPLHLMCSLNYSPTFDSQVTDTHYIPVTYSCQHSVSHIYIYPSGQFFSNHTYLSIKCSHPKTQLLKNLKLLLPTQNLYPVQVQFSNCYLMSYSGKYLVIHPLSISAHLLNYPPRLTTLNHHHDITVVVPKFCISSFTLQTD